MTAVVEELSLFDVAPDLVEAPSAPTIQERFEAFHRANPWVYVALVRLARDQVARGRSRVGVKGLFEVLRWHYGREAAAGAAEFRLNNDYTARYARLIAAEEPDLAHVFEVRRLRSEGAS